MNTTHHTFTKKDRAAMKGKQSKSAKSGALIRQSQQEMRGHRMAHPQTSKPDMQMSGGGQRVGEFGHIGAMLSSSKSK